MRRYSTAFERDFCWYLSKRHVFTFDGRLPRDIPFDRNGMDGRKAFFLYDSHGKVMPTRHPLLVASLMRTKGSVNLHIKMWAEDRANGILPRVLFDDICVQLNLLDWIIEAVEKQKGRYYTKAD